MKTVRSVAAMQRHSAALRRAGKRIALVPTMGYLHDGHLSLVRRAARSADVVIVSIFVNPTQFGPREDFGRYPRDPARDRKLLREQGCCDIIFAPEACDMYAADVSTVIEESTVSSGLCGAARPGHFRGVTTVVAKLFNITRPHVAVFGQKDLQQTRVIRRMVRDLNMDVRILEAAIVREPDGLAMSSRNRYLSAVERKQALVLSRALRHARTRVARNGRLSAGDIKKEMKKMIGAAGGVRLEYLETVDADTLEPVRSLTGRTAIVLAARVGGTRLIDNVIVRKAVKN